MGRVGVAKLLVITNVTGGRAGGVTALIPPPDKMAARDSVLCRQTDRQTYSRRYCGKPENRGVALLYIRTITRILIDDRGHTDRVLKWRPQLALTLNS